jgi:DNA-binding NtrC family response regulator
MKGGLTGEEKPKVLVIDDDKNLRKTLTDILKAKGYEVRTAKDGAAGLAIFRKEPVNLALIDLRLPDMSGIDVLNSVKDESPSTQAIILTGSATLDSAIEATNRGAFSYLQKPYEIDQLMVNIRRALEKQQAEEKIVRDSRELQRMTGWRH